MQSGINMSGVKEQNRSLILRYMNANDGVSRKEIAEATGLTPASVTQICAEFLDMRLIKECGADTDAQGAGRRKVRLSINSEYAYILGVNIESDDTNVVICNLAGDIKAEIRLDTCSTDEIDTFIDDIAGKLAIVYKDNPKIKRKIIGGCVAISGEVDKVRGTSVHAYGIWDQEIELCEMLTDRLGVTFIIENNIDAYAYAEMVYGIAASYDNVLVVKWGPGVGCSIIIDGKIYEGRHGRSAELGHNIVDPNGIRCACGRTGCLETKISYKAMQKKKSFDVESFGDVIDAFESEIDIFARTLVNAMSILAPNRVVLCGKLFDDNRIRDALIKKCSSYYGKYNEERILYTPLADSQDYIGPIATYIEREMF